MATSADALAIALQHHHAGRLQEAEQIYRQILDADPSNVAAWHLLGRLADQFGKRETAVECLRRALSIWPDYAEAYSDLGTVLEAQGNLAEADSAYRRAIELKPGYAEAHFNLGNTLQKQGNKSAAIISFRQALNANPGLAPAHTSLASLLTEEGKLDEAVSHFHDALRLIPRDPLALFGLGFALQQQGKLNDALACFRIALDVQPDNVDAQFNLGTILEQQGNLDEAVGCYRRVLEFKPDHETANHQLCRLLMINGCLDEALVRIGSLLKIKPDCADAINNLGIVHSERQQWDEAASCFNRAIDLKPDLAEAYANLGNTLLAQRDFDAVQKHYDKAIELKPDYADAHFSRALAWLLTGDFEHGWPEYEWRWRTGKFHALNFPQPQWKGEPLTGKTLFIHAEQGFGDTIQFVRYAPLVKELGATVIFGCQDRLLKLLSGVRGVDRLITRGSQLSEFDFHTPLLSLPGILNTTLATIPADVPYLFAAPALVALWREKLRDLRGFRIGINWRGNQDVVAYRNRHIPLEFFALLTEVPQTCFVTLQKEVDREEIAKARGFFQGIDPGEDFDDSHGAFMDTAAIMMNLDLVITSDTSVAHLAGALGVPVWVALPFAADWRWLLDRSDSPWYPTMRLFRQKTPGDWADVFEEIAAALTKLVQR